MMMDLTSLVHFLMTDTSSHSGFQCLNHYPRKCVSVPWMAILWRGISPNMGDKFVCYDLKVIKRFARNLWCLKMRCSTLFHQIGETAGKQVLKFGWCFGCKATENNCFRLASCQFNYITAHLKQLTRSKNHLFSLFAPVTVEQALYLDLLRPELLCLNLPVLPCS